MITRGIIIGKLIDDLSKLQGQIDLRCQLGLTDLNKYCEDFIKDVINVCWNLNLKNLNTDRSNEPGLDLGDIKNKTAFQITSTSTSQKVNHTLDTITEEQLTQYSTFKIFILGKKQGSYEAVEQALIAKCSFALDNIIDISDLCKQTITLKYEDLYTLYKMFEKEFQIVLTEIEIPNKEGQYPTSFSDKLEVIPNTVCKNAAKLISVYPDCTLEEAIEAFNSLSKLPRITRDFLENIIKLSDNDAGNFRVNYQELKRKLRVPESEIKEELGILSKRRFVFEPEDDDPTVSTRFDDCLISIVDFAINNQCLTKVLVALDFTLLDDDE